MLCARCSHPLPPRADRCARCFALNPELAPVALSFDDEPQPAVTEPAPAVARAPSLAPGRSFLFDAALVCALTALCAFAALKIGRVRYPLDFLRDTARLWIVLAAALAIAWSLLARALRLRDDR